MQHGQMLSQSWPAMKYLADEFKVRTHIGKLCHRHRAIVSQMPVELSLAYSSRQIEACQGNFNYSGLWRSTGIGCCMQRRARARIQQLSVYTCIRVRHNVNYVCALSTATNPWEYTDKNLILAPSSMITHPEVRQGRWQVRANQWDSKETRPSFVSSIYLYITTVVRQN